MEASDHNSAPVAGAFRARLLLVDDEPELRRVFRRSLERGGYFVVEAADGQAALELSRRMEFDVVVSDICMPLMSGLELLDRLLIEAPELPVLFVSGSTHVMDLDAALGCGAFDFLQKPVDLAELAARAALAAAENRRRREQGVRLGRDSEAHGLSSPLGQRTRGS
jgi:DNA-binding NtrC family response regulator